MGQSGRGPKGAATIGTSGNRHSSGELRDCDFSKSGHHTPRTHPGNTGCRCSTVHEFGCHEFWLQRGTKRATLDSHAISPKWCDPPRHSAGVPGAIGGAIANKLSSLGANVILTGTNKKKIDDLEKKLGPNSLGLIADLSKDEEIANLYNESIKKFKSIDILVNNAGINRDALSIRMTKEQWNEVININLSAAFKLSQLVIKSMMKKKWGRIVGISSIIGIRGNVGQANYAASKAGIIGLHKSLALEFASRGITVNCIAPGFIESPMTEALSDEQKEIMLKKIPIGNIGKPEDIANCVAFLTDEKASFITGSTVNINGGMLMV